MQEEELSKWDQLRAFTDEIRMQHGVSGVALGIFHDGEVRATGFGVTNVENPLDVTDRTLFQIGSITKTFTGTLIIKMLEDGKMDLDATIPSHWDWLKKTG
jgi:CubicO group peptidase (beta-lactamase class C family)